VAHTKPLKQHCKFWIACTYTWQVYDIWSCNRHVLHYFCCTGHLPKVPDRLLTVWWSDFTCLWKSLLSFEKLWKTGHSIGICLIPVLNHLYSSFIAVILAAWRENIAPLWFEIKRPRKAKCKFKVWNQVRPATVLEPSLSNYERS